MPKPTPIVRPTFSVQPLKGLYIIYQLVTTIFVRIPVWSLLSLPRWNRPRRTWTLGRCLQVHLLRHYFNISEKTGHLIPWPTHRAIKHGRGINGVWVEAAPHLITGEVKKWADVAGVSSVRIPAYWIHKRWIDLEPSAPAIPGEKVIYSLHGGGYVSLSAHPNDISATIPRGLLRYVKPVQRVFSLEYRLSQGKPLEEEYPFPAALIDAIAGYHYLVNVVGISESDIIIEGDSAGGNLALALVRYIIEHQSELPLGIPSGLILLSPWCDIGQSHNHKNGTIQLFKGSDYIPVGKPGRAIYSQKAFTGVHGLGIAESNRYISPGSKNPQLLDVSFKGFPRTFIAVGGAEILYDEISMLNEKMTRDLGVGKGVTKEEGKVTFHVARNAVHDYVVFDWHEPERSETLKAISEWITAAE